MCCEGLNHQALEVWKRSEHLGRQCATRINYPSLETLRGTPHRVQANSNAPAYPLHFDAADPIGLGEPEQMTMCQSKRN
jgi:hypothetical protein